jgi:hypothetical protein
MNQVSDRGTNTHLQRFLEGNLRAVCSVQNSPDQRYKERKSRKTD